MTWTNRRGVCMRGTRYCGGHIIPTTQSHDDVIKWKHFPRYLSFVRGIHRWPVNSPHKGQWRRALMFSLICAWINYWVNSREAGDLRCHHAHYDIIIMHFHFHMTPSWHGNAFRITAFLWGGSTGHQWIPLTKGQWCPFYVFFVVVPRSYLTNTRVACDLRRPDAHVMLLYERCRPVTAKCTPTNIGQFLISRWWRGLNSIYLIPHPTTPPNKTKWLQFRRRYIQMHFREWKVLYFDQNFTEVCSSRSNWQYISLGLGNGLVPNRRQAIIWTNADQIHWPIYAALGGDELIPYILFSQLIMTNVRWATQII